VADLEKTIELIIAAAWADDNFRERLTAPENSQDDIKKILKDEGLAFPDIDDLPHGGKVLFVANTTDTRYVLIPQKPAFTDEDMGLIIKLRQLQSKVCTCNNECTASLKEKLEDIVHKFFDHE